MPRPVNRGEGIALPVPKIGMPTRVFLFTVDQISVMLNLSEEQIMKRYMYFEGRSIGPRRRDLMIARNIAPEDAKPEWRVAEREFVRWMRTKGFRYHDLGAFGS